MAGQWGRQTWGWGQYAPQWGQQRTVGYGNTSLLPSGHLAGQRRHQGHPGRVSGQYATRTPSDPYKKRILDDVRRAPYRNTAYAVPYYQYGY